MSRGAERPDANAQQSPAAPARKPYAPPTLKRLGSVRELTLSGASTGTDKMGGSGKGNM
jgi:hypothetical protein